MALTQCSECNREISDQAAACPHCGAPRGTPITQPAGATATRFTNPKTGQTVSIEYAGVWTFLFGPLYLTLRGAYAHAIVSALVAIVTVGVSWLIYPFFGQTIVRRTLLERGWKPLADDAIGAPQATPVDRSRDRWIWLFFAAVALVVIIAGAAMKS